MLQELNDQRLTLFVNEIRGNLPEDIQSKPDAHDLVPYFDPADGGVAAEWLFLLEAPGPNAVTSGFVSRDNPDETAKNWFELNNDARILRTRTLMWNIVPWYLGENGKIRPARKADIDAGWEWLLKLLDLLRPYKRLCRVVLVGRKAQRITTRLQEARPDLVVEQCLHPSPSFINRNPKENRLRVLAELKTAAGVLGDG